MANSFLSNGLLGMGGFNGMSAQLPNSLLGDMYDPKAARNYQMKQMLLGLGLGLMSEKGMGRGAEMALTMGNQAGRDYRDTALEAYRLKTAQEDRDYNRQWQQDERTYNRERDKRSDAWTNTNNQHTLETWQAEDEKRRREDELRQGKQNAVTGWMQNYAQQGGTLPFSPEVRGLARQGGLGGVSGTDEWRYGQMQPYAQSGDYETAFGNMTAAPPAPEEYTLGEGQIRYRGDTPIAAGPRKNEPPRTRDYLDGTDRVYEEQLPDGSWHQIGRGPAYKTTPDVVNNNNLGGGGSDTQVFNETKERSAAARAAATGLQSLNTAEQALPGAITGAAAEQRLALQKIAAYFGVGDTESIVDTETFRSAIAPQVAAMLKSTVGSTQISNADREFAEKAAAGSINLDERSIGRLINIMQAANSETIRNFNRDLDRIYPEGQGFDRERALFGVQQVPARYPAPIGPRMPGSAADPVSLKKKYGLE